MDELWQQLAAGAGLALDEPTEVRLARYLELLLEANARMNLTRITDPLEARIGLVGDALTLLPHLPPGPIKLADVGTGGGVPGIPLAIVRSDASVTLIEATQKKGAFLRETVAALALTNVQVVAQRAEDAGHSALRQTFDVVVARAVGSLDFLVEWCLPLLRKGGKLLAPKGPKTAEELPAARKAIAILGGGQPIIHPVTLPGTTGHVIVEIPKTGGTPAKYPRPASIAKGKPIT